MKPSRKTSGATRCRWTICFDSVENDSPILALILRSPVDVQKDAKRAYQLFHGNPSHPGLQFKKLEGGDDIYSVRIGLDYRALAVMKKDRVIWYWIGSHSDYDHLV